MARAIPSLLLSLACRLAGPWVACALSFGAGPLAFAAPAPLAQQLAAGGAHSCALTAAGALLCWGGNAHGQLGDGTTTDRLTPIEVPSLSAGVTAVALGDEHTCALTTDGEVQCWGLNDHSGRTTVPRAVKGLSGRAIAIAAGSAHTCALIETGAVQCWGDNTTGQLGDGTTHYRDTPVDVVGLQHGVSAIGAGIAHTCALTDGGAVKCWGGNFVGQLGNGTDVQRLLPVDVLGLSGGVSAITVGRDHNCVLLDAGKAQCWGSGDAGKLGDGWNSTRVAPTDVLGLDQGVIAIAAGAEHTCALGEDGQLSCWGSNLSGQLGSGTKVDRWTPQEVIGAPNGVRALVAGEGHTCALLHSRGVKCWGDNLLGQLGDGSTTMRTAPTDVVGFPGLPGRIVAGTGHTCALIGIGTKLKCWGGNQAGQLGDGTHADRWAPIELPGLPAAIASAAGSNHSCAVAGDGTVRCWGSNPFGQLGDGATSERATPQNVLGLSERVAAIAGGAGHTCALTVAGKVQCWGDNRAGQLGDGTTIARVTPVEVTGLASRVMAIAAGDNHTCALLSVGEVACWGRNHFGQLGDGTTTDRTAPTSVANLVGVTVLAAGGDHTCALAGKVIVCWGSNEAGQLGDGTTLASAKPVEVGGVDTAVTALALGGRHSCALVAGEVKCWGSNRNGQLGDGTTIDRATAGDVIGFDGTAVALGAGQDHTCALTDAQSVMCWGHNHSGQLGDGSANDRTTPLPIGRLQQSIMFEPTSTQIPYASTITLIATASSGLPVAFVSLSPAVCTASAQGVITAVGATGESCAIRAQQEGNGSFDAAPAQTRTFELVRAAQTIQFYAIRPQRLSDRVATVRAVGGGSGLPVVLTSLTPAVCTVGGGDGATVALVTLGTCQIRASQAGDNNFIEAASVEQSFEISAESEDLDGKWWRWRGGGCAIATTARADWSFALLLLWVLAARVRSACDVRR